MMRSCGSGSTRPPLGPRDAVVVTVSALIAPLRVPPTIAAAVAVVAAAAAAATAAVLFALFNNGALPAASSSSSLLALLGFLLALLLGLLPLALALAPAALLAVTRIRLAAGIRRTPVVILLVTAAPAVVVTLFLAGLVSCLVLILLVVVPLALLGTLLLRFFLLLPLPLQLLPVLGRSGAVLLFFAGSVFLPMAASGYVALVRSVLRRHALQVTAATIAMVVVVVMVVLGRARREDLPAILDDNPLEGDRRVLSVGLHLGHLGQGVRARL